MKEGYERLEMTMNQYGVVKNTYQNQDKYKRVLFLCSAGILRSATAAHVFSAEPYNWNTRTAGVSIRHALNPVSEALLNWADKVYCMENENYHELEYIFEDTLNDLLEEKGKDFIKVLNIPDTYPYRDPELVELLKQKVVNITQGE
jgi:predicted protein tyrosine phosphatase